MVLAESIVKNFRNTIKNLNKFFISTSPIFISDNGAMICLRYKEAHLDLYELLLLISISTT